MASPDPRSPGPPEDSEPNHYLRVTIIVTVGMVVGALLTWIPDQPSPWAWLPLGVAYLVGGVPIARDTWASLKEGKLSIDFLMGAAALGAAGVGQPLEGVILIFLFSLSNTLEAYALGRTRRAIGALKGLHPDEATLLDDAGNEVGRVSTAELTPGQRIRVRPGERIGADGRVVEGRSEVDQAAITGESTPVRRGEGDDVFAGTINGTGALTVEVSRPPHDTMISRIIRMVEEAREDRAPAQEFIDRFAHPYTVLVLVGTAAAILVAALALGMTWSDAIYRGMTLLVVASPCALVISTPSAILSAISNGARQGILFKGGGILESAGRADTVAFDKTGTLTVGEPRLLEIRTEPGVDRTDLLTRVAAAEADSEHHLAHAILRAAKEEGLDAPRATDFRALPGEGITAQVEGEPLWIGNRLLARRHDAAVPPDTQTWLEAEGEEGRSVVLAGRGDRLLGALAFGDELRPGARELLEQLREEGIRRIVILSGDHDRVVQGIAREVGADEARGELLPDQKVEVLRELARDARGVIMVGDGVNDAPAMASAAVGVAMGAAGTDVAIETADVVLMADDLPRVREMIRLGRRSRRIVRQNVWFSVGWMAVLVVVASTVGIPLTLAVVAHEGSTLLVVLNGLRLMVGR